MSLCLLRIVIIAGIDRMAVGEIEEMTIFSLKMNVLKKKRMSLCFLKTEILS